MGLRQACVRQIGQKRCYPRNGFNSNPRHQQGIWDDTCVSLCLRLHVTCDKCVSASLWDSTVTFRLSLHHQLSYPLHGPYLLHCVWVHRARLLFPSHWAETTRFGNQSNLTKFILVFMPFCFFLICLLCLDERLVFICIFMERCTAWTETTGELLFPVDFSDANAILVDSPKTGLNHAMQWLPLCFPVCDQNGRWQWPTHVGSTARSTDAVTYS